jgi:phosphopantetheine adenylyltransferase/PAS domain-containing protein
MFLDLKQEIQSILEEQNNYKKVVALYGGGFKPPTKGHYAVVEKALKQNPEIDEMIVYIGNAERDGVTQDQSEKIWNIYAKYLPYKVKFDKVASPIRSIFDYAKNNPDEKIIWVIGAREGNEEDFNDIATRTKNASLRPNIQVETIITANQVSGTAARNAVSSTLEKFRIFLPDFIKDDEAEEIFALLKTGELVSENLQDRKDTPNLYNLARKYNVGLYKIITNLLKGAKIEMANVEDEEMAMNQSFNMISKDLDYYDKNLNEELENDSDVILKYIAPLTKFMESEGLVFKPYPKIKLIKDDVENGEKVLGNTAHFDPNNNVIVLYTYKRHPKDILRSYAHELIHVYQNVEDRLNGMSNTTNVNEDDYLEKLEREAYEKGNILFRKWANSLEQQDLNESTDIDFQNLEKVLDDMFADVDIDVNFTRHFRERVTQRKLTQEDIIDLMQKIHDKYGEDLADLPKNSNRVFTHLTKLIDIASGIGGWNADGLKNLDLITAFKRDHVSQPEFRTNAQSPKLKVNEVIVGEKIECDNCGWSWDIKDGGDDLFICHKCGHDNTPLQESKTKDPFGLNAYTMELARLAEGEEGYKIYVDMDGVIADFDLRFKQVTGLTPDEFESKHGLEKFWEVIDIDNKVKFWVGIPLMNGAKDLIDYVKNYDYELLTAPSRQKSSMLGKRLWVKKNVGSLFPSTPKINFRQAENKSKIKKQLTDKDILIDDKKSTIDSWDSKGGTGILYVSAEQAISRLKELGL